MSAPRFDPASYPGVRPEGPCLVRDGRAHPLVLDGPRTDPWRTPAPVAPPPVDELYLGVAYGSNANVDRLADKRLDGEGAVLLPARMRGWRPAFAARRTHYGSVPLTLVPDEQDRVLDTWVLGVPGTSLEALDLTEGRWLEPDAEDATRRVARIWPESGYELGRIGPVAVADRFLLADALAYLPAPDSRILHDDGGWLTWPEHDQVGARAALDEGVTARPAPPGERVEPGPWPSTPLEDLPMLVYGTLRPGEPAWPRIAELVEVVGPATTAGRLFDTGHGWPAAQLGGDGRLEGVLLAPRGPGEAAELVRRADEYEGVPSLFAREAVPVATGDGDRTWAMTYRWAAGTPPGRALADGRW